VVAAGKSPAEGRELLDDAAVALEELYLGLRTADGLAGDRVPPEVRRRWEAEGWAMPGAARVRLSAEGWLRLDPLVASIAS
jgi:hypothetical protein